MSIKYGMSEVRELDLVDVDAHAGVLRGGAVKCCHLPAAIRAVAPLYPNQVLKKGT